MKIDKTRYTPNTIKQGKNIDKSLDAAETDGICEEILIIPRSILILKNPRTISKIFGMLGITRPKITPVIAFLVRIAIVTAKLMCAITKRIRAITEKHSNQDKELSPCQICCLYKLP